VWMVYTGRTAIRPVQSCREALGSDCLNDHVIVLNGRDSKSLRWRGPHGQAVLSLNTEQSWWSKPLIMKHVYITNQELYGSGKATLRARLMYPAWESGSACSA
jgi:hypothetical protein